MLSAAFLRVLRTMGRETQNIGVFWVPTIPVLGREGRVTTSEADFSFPSMGVFRGALLLHGWDIVDYHLSCGSQKTH